MAKRDYKLTEAKVARFIKEGRGSGAGAEYKPWLTIHDLSSTGLSTRIKGRKSGRLHHFLSALERDVFLECDWAEDVVDIREQFPLDRERTRSIAAAMGIRHPGANGVDAVMTTDILLDVRRAAGTRHVALSVKPHGRLDDGRALQKLELERRYWLEDGVPWWLVTERQINKIRAANLLWLHEWYWVERQEFPRQGYWEDRCRTFLEATASFHPTAPFGAVVRHLEDVHGFAGGEAISVVRHLAAHRRVLMDLDTLFDAKGPLSQIKPAGGLRRAPEAA